MGGGEAAGDGRSGGGATAGRRSPSQDTLHLPLSY